MDDQRDFPASDLAQLVGSRLCHDLVNPISAISNGLELLSLSGATPSPELELIGDAVRDALTRIRFFRLAFGAARPGESISRRETLEVLDGLYGTGRLEVDWTTTHELPRQEVKLAFLLLNCAETALPLGGNITISHGPEGWTLTGTGRKLSVDDPCWQALRTADLAAIPPPSRVQFTLLIQEITRRSASIVFEVTPETNGISLRIQHS